MDYIKIKFTKGLDCEAYQEIAYGIVLNYLDENGKELNLPNVTESGVIDANPPRLNWMRDELPPQDY